MLSGFRLLPILSISGALLASGCSDNNNGPDPIVGPATVPFQEIIDQGVTRYLGSFSPMLAETDGDVVNHSFGAGDGPLCLDGSEFSMATRDKGSEDLVIFLQGGGACWSELCLATESVSKGIPKAGILDPDLPGNPVGNWNTVYVPYCDGGLHVSDIDSDSDGDGQIDRYQRGLRNLSASLDVAVTTFPSPKRILLTGISAGGFGTTYALPLVRTLYPGVPIDVINDSGLGIGRPNDPDFIRLLIRDWHTEAFFPASCPTCIGADGHTTDYHKWELAQDPDMRLGMMSYKQDAVVSGTFAQIGGEAFEQALLPELEDVEAAYPERAHSFVRDGNQHTFLLSDTSLTAGGVTVLDWVTTMLDGSRDRVSTSD
jgi:hypothetical protein